jgi:hypothetical protein
MRGLRDSVSRCATRGSEPFRVTHAEEPIAVRGLASTFGEMHAENVIFSVFRAGTGMYRSARSFILPDRFRASTNSWTYLDLDRG